MDAATAVTPVAVTGSDELLLNTIVGPAFKTARPAGSSPSATLGVASRAVLAAFLLRDMRAFLRLLEEKGEIGLAREQAVDRAVIDLTQKREQYLDALLAIAGARPQLDLAPAPLFLRKRHLKQRVVSILKEVRMSKTRLISALTAGLGILAAACWLITSTFPLMAAPQAPDAPGVAVNLFVRRRQDRSRQQGTSTKTLA